MAATLRVLDAATACVRAFREALDSRSPGNEALLQQSREALARSRSVLHRVSRRPPAEVAWCSAFTLQYADRAGCGLHEGKRVARWVHPSLYLLAPSDAARLLASIAGFEALRLRDPARDRRGDRPVA